MRTPPTRNSVMETSITPSTERSTTENVKKKRIAQIPQNISQTKQNIQPNPQIVINTQSSKHNSLKISEKHPTMTKITAINRSDNLWWTTKEKWRNQRNQSPRCWTTKKGKTILIKMSFFEGQSLINTVEQIYDACPKYSELGNFRIIAYLYFSDDSRR